MSNRIPLEEILHSEAEFGLFYAYAKLASKKVLELREQGFVVTDSMEGRKFPRTHRIAWAHAIIDSKNLNELDENDPRYTPAQKLWIISTKNKPESEWKN